MRRALTLNLLAAVALAQYPSPLRVSDSKNLPATISTKVIDIRDQNGSGLKWDIRGDIGNPAAQINRILIRDNAGVSVLELQRTFLLGVVSNEAILDMHFLPRTDGDRILGSATNRWGEAHINRLRSNFVVPPSGDVEVDGNVLLTAGKSLGKSAQRIPTLYVQDLDCAGSGCPGVGASFWSRDSGAGRIFPTTATDDVRFRKWLIEDSSGVGGGFTWDIWGEIGNPAAFSNRVFLRDNAGTKVIEFERSFLGVTSNRTYLDMHFLPRTDATRNLGESGSRWADAYINRLRANFIVPLGGSGSTLELDGDLAISAGNSIGLPGQRVPTLYVQNLDCAGTGCPSGASVWSRNSGSGYLFPVTTTDDVRFRKWQIESNEGSGLFWDFQAEVTGASPGTRRAYLRDNAGVKVIEFERSFVGSVSDVTRLDTALEPLTTNARKLGSSTRLWSEAHVLSTFTQGISSAGGSSVIAFNHTLEPGTHLTQSLGTISKRVNEIWAGQIDSLGVRPDQDYTVLARTLGTPSQRWGHLYTRDITMTGTFTCTGVGCPGGGWTELSDRLHPTNTAKSVVIGASAAASSMLDVYGSAIIRGRLESLGDTVTASDFYCATDSGCNIGDTSSFTPGGKPSSIYTGNGMFVYGGTSLPRAVYGAGSATWRDSAGSTQLHVGLSAGIPDVRIFGTTLPSTYTATFAAPGGGTCTVTWTSGWRTGGTC